MFMKTCHTKVKCKNKIKKWKYLCCYASDHFIKIANNAFTFVLCVFWYFEARNFLWVLNFITKEKKPLGLILQGIFEIRFENNIYQRWKIVQWKFSKILLEIKLFISLKQPLTFSNPHPHIFLTQYCMWKYFNLWDIHIKTKQNFSFQYQGISMLKYFLISSRMQMKNMNVCGKIVLHKIRRIYSLSLCKSIKQMLRKQE